MDFSELLVFQIEINIHQPSTKHFMIFMEAEKGDTRIKLGEPLKFPMTYILPGKTMAGQWEIL